MAHTQVSSLSTAGTTAFDKLAYFALRDQLHFDQIASVKPSPTHRGSSVQFAIYDDLAAATSALTETSDVTAVAMSDSNVTVTLVEYGNVVTTTAKARGTDLLELDRDAANVVGYNAGISVDTLARTAVGAGSTVQYASTATSTATVGAAMILDSGEVREAVATLRGANSMPISGSNYVGYMHPDQSYDLRGETGNAGWAEAALNSDAGRVWAGSVGSFNGVEWIETPRVVLTADGGVTTTDVYDTIIVGHQALAKAYSSNESAALPQVRFGPTTDTLQRFNHVGWYWLGGYARFREDSIIRVETASSIGDN